MPGGLDSPFRIGRAWGGLPRAKLEFPSRERTMQISQRVGTNGWLDDFGGGEFE